MVSHDLNFHSSKLLKGIINKKGNCTINYIFTSMVSHVYDFSWRKHICDILPDFWIRCCCGSISSI